MKYLRKFNEELKISTYKSAANKLLKKGHRKRSSNIEEHIENIKWKEKIDIFKKWGDCEISDENHLHKGFSYIGLYFLDDSTYESIYDAINEQKNSLDIFFKIIIIPKDEESRSNYFKRLSKSAFANGFFWGPSITLNYKINDDRELIFEKVTITDKSFKLTRRSSVIIKKQLLDCFSQGSNYPEIENNLVMFNFINDLLQREDFTLEFNYTMDDIYKDIESISINDLYTQ
jgi:hypothetical protein